MNWSWYKSFFHLIFYLKPMVWNHHRLHQILSARWIQTSFQFTEKQFCIFDCFRVHFIIFTLKNVFLNCQTIVICKSEVIFIAYAHEHFINFRMMNFIGVFSEHEEQWKLHLLLKAFFIFARLICYRQSFRSNIVHDFQNANEGQRFRVFGLTVIFRMLIHFWIEMLKITLLMVMVCWGRVKD